MLVSKFEQMNRLKGYGALQSCLADEEEKEVADLLSLSSENDKRCKMCGLYGRQHLKGSDICIHCFLKFLRTPTKRFKDAKGYAFTVGDKSTGGRLNRLFKFRRELENSGIANKMLEYVSTWGKLNQGDLK